MKLIKLFSRALAHASDYQKSLEDRIAALEGDVAALRVENARLKMSREAERVLETRRETVLRYIQRNKSLLARWNAASEEEREAMVTEVALVIANSSSA